MIRNIAAATTAHEARSALLAFVLLLTLAACDVPNFEGPQIQSPPPAFFLQDESYQQRRMFPQYELVYHDAWVETSDGHLSTIFIDGHPGVLTEDDIYAAQDSAKLLAVQPITFDPIERLTIDGRDAWGWAERLQTPQRGLDWIAYKAMVPYDTITYTIELLGGDPGLKSHPDTLKVILSSFAVGKTTWNIPLIAILLGGSLMLINFGRSRAAIRSRRLQSITLKKISKEQLDRANTRAAALQADADAKAKAQAAADVTPLEEIEPLPEAPAAPAPPPTAAPTSPKSIADAIRRATAAKSPSGAKPPTDPSGSS